MAKTKKSKKGAVMPTATFLSFMFFLLLPAISYSASAGQLCTMHMNSPRGPHLLDCAYCHEGNPDLRVLNNGLTLTNTDLCDQCHSPQGQFDGVNDAVIGAKANWQTGGVYDNETGNLKEGKEKWCVGCHDDGVCKISGVPAPNTAGLSVSCGDWYSPGSIFSSKVAGADKLIDHDQETGCTGGEIIFDLGSPAYVSSVRLYTVTATSETANWQLWGGNNDGTPWSRLSFGKAVLFAAPTWKTESAQGWNELRLDGFIPVRYLKLVKASSWPLSKSYLREFEVKQCLEYGYYTTGHKIRCEHCHNVASPHIDGVAQTYKAKDNYLVNDPQKYQNGYRLRSVQVGEEIVPPMEIPRIGCNNGDKPKTDNDFALCFTCHDKYKLLGDAYGSGDFLKDPPVTNFRNESHIDGNGKVSNEHLRHLRGRGYCGNGKDWDSDWDGTSDSPQSCTACHNVHGSPNPAMTRHGELASTPGSVDKAPMINLQYLDADGKADPGILNPSQSIGGQTQFMGSGSGSVAKNKICNMCHNDQMTYFREPVLSPISQCQSCHTQMADTSDYGPSHATHLEADPRGPTVGCTVCHSDCSAGSPHLRLFADGKNLTGTTACDPCHSKDGVFDGINDPLIGAKANWQEGVYKKPERIDLKLCLENWCAGCHDQGTSVCSNVAAPNVMGDNATYGYNITGHKIVCSACHDLTVIHTDGDPRTYSHNSNPAAPGDLHNYQNGYRLKYGMTIPLQGSSGSDPARFDLCFRCHDDTKLLNSVAPFQTNFQDDDLVSGVMTQINRHQSHLTAGATAWDSDWDYLQVGASAAVDSRMSCTACHNVHGSLNPAMTRHGELISTPGTQDKVPALSFRWYKDDGYTVTIFGEESHYGDMPPLGGVGSGSLEDSMVCNGCHGGNALIKYNRGGDYQTLPMPTGNWDNPPLPPSMRLLNPAPGSQDIAVVDNDLNFILLSNGNDNLDWGTFSVTIQGTISPAQVYDYNSGGVEVDPISVSLHGDSAVTIHPLVRFADHEEVTVKVSIEDVAGHKLTSPNWYFNTGASSPVWRSPKAVYTETSFPYPDLLIDDNPATGNPFSPSAVHWVVYDLGTIYNVSQIRFLIPCPQGRSWTISVSNDPDNFATDVKTNWLAEPGSMITVDNTQATFYPNVSDWPSANTPGSGYYGTNFQTHTAVYGTSTATCTWKPQVPSDGSYLVYVRWTSGTDRTTDAAYTINHNGESETLSRDQQVNGGQWNLLGTYYFAQGNSDSIVLSNASSSVDADSRYVIADAIRLVPESTLPAWVSTSFTPTPGRYLKLYTAQGSLSKDTIKEVDFAEPTP